MSLLAEGSIDMTKLLVTRPLPAAVMAVLADLDCTMRDTNTPMTLEETSAALADYDLILPTLGDDFSAKAFAGDIRCRLLANFGVGYNHIDVSAASSARLRSRTRRGCHRRDSRYCPDTYAHDQPPRRKKNVWSGGQWAGWHPTQMLGLRMSGKTVGIVGMGRIGQAIAKRCHFGFGMQVVYYNRSAKSVECLRVRLDAP